MNTTPTLSLVWLAMLGFCLSSATGQENNKEDGGKKKFLRVTLLPVGDFPVTGAVIVNDRPVVVMPKPSELVPTPVFVKDGNDYKSLNLTMNSPSAHWRRPVGSVISVLMQKNGKYDPYMTVTLPEEKEDVTVFMLRNKQSKSWVSDPRTVVFKNGPESFPLGSARLINFSSVPLHATIGTKNYLISPQSCKIVADPGTADGEVFFTYQIVAKINGRNLSLASTAVSYDKLSRVNLVMYDRDGKSEIRQEGDDRPVKIVKYFERPYEPPADALPDPGTPAARAVPNSARITTP